MNKIKINNIEISVEEFKRLAKENEALLKEPEVKGRYFFPKFGEGYWYISDVGNILYDKNSGSASAVDRRRISTGKCYRTKEEAELALKKQQAIVRCWKWQQENTPFEPDWGDSEQDKYYCNFNHERNKLFAYGCQFIQEQFTLPYFKSGEDRDAFIKANKEDLLLLFTK